MISRMDWCLLYLIDAIIPVFQTKKPPVEDLFSDLCDGRRLLELLEGLAGHQLVWTRTHIHSQTRLLKAVLLSVTPKWGAKKRINCRQLKAQNTPFKGRPFGIVQLLIFFYRVFPYSGEKRCLLGLFFHSFPLFTDKTINLVWKYSADLW